MPGAVELADARIVCYATDGNAIGGQNRAGDRAKTLLPKIHAAISAGVDWLQIREKDLQGRALLALVREAVRAAGAPRGGSVGKTQVIVNDRVDVALAAGAAGVHLGGESLPCAQVSRWSRVGNAPPGWRIGASCHSLEEAREAESSGASYIFFGPVFDTPSKRPFGAPQGIAKLHDVCGAVHIPVIAIGGIDESNARECFRAGAGGVAAIRLFQDQNNPEELKRTIEKLHSLG